MRYFLLSLEVVCGLFDFWYYEEVPSPISEAFKVFNKEGFDSVLIFYLVDVMNLLAEEVPSLCL